VGIVPLERALQLAADVDLDLVEVAPMARPPVCKLMDFGKFKYESDIKAREARRNQQHTVNKEMKLRPKIDSHDYETKKGHVVRFLKAGNKVKVTIMFRGREQSRPELGFRLLKRLSEEVADLGFVEAAPKQDGRNMIMVLAPHRSTKAAATAKTGGPRETAESAPAPAEPAPAAASAPPAAPRPGPSRPGSAEPRPGPAGRPAAARPRPAAVSAAARVDRGSNDRSGSTASHASGPRTAGDK
jgi:translation initiation factor IF-3